MNAAQIIKVHDNLWKSKPRSFNSIRAAGLRFVTQNLTKRSKNTDWINGDPENRKLTWVFGSLGAKAYVREYKSQGKTIIEIHKLNPDVVWHREERA